MRQSLSKTINMKKIGLIIIALALPLGALAQSAEECYSKAMNYNNGWGGVQKDPVQAAKWFLKAAEKGHKDGQALIALRYSQGDGIQKDMGEAYKWFLKAAEQGDASSQYFLGRMYKTGDYVEKDIKEAIKWLTKAAEQDQAFAQNT